MKAKWIRCGVAASVFVAACGSPQHGTQTDAPKAEPFRPVTEQPAGPAVALRVETATGELKPIWFPPVREGKAPRDAVSPLTRPFASGAADAIGANGPGVKGADPGVRPQAEVTVDDETVTDDPGWWLIAGAAAECGMHEGGERPGIDSPPVLPPWSSGCWYIFDHVPESCDELTLFAETLLCIADKLDVVATTTVPIRWEKIGTVPHEQLEEPWGIPEGSWIIPPQSEQDRFIALDQARSLIGLIVAMETTRTGEEELNCSERYADVMANPLHAETQSYSLFGANFGYAPVYPMAPVVATAPVTISGDNAAELAGERLLARTHILRAASRMLESNVKRSVMSDLASAETRRGLATDLIGGNRAAWGLNADGTVDHYNTYGHALRVLEGRVEIGPEGYPLSDPACGNVAATEVMRLANGNVTESRITAPKIENAAQQEATCILESMGIVDPYAQEAPIEDTRKGIADQAVILAGQRVGIATTSEEWADFAEGPTAQLVEEQINGISDGDLLFGLRQTKAAFALLMNESETGMETPLCGERGIACADRPQTFGSGVAIEGGIPKADLITPIKARAAGLSAAAQCRQSRFGTHTTADTPLETLDSGQLTPAVFQNPFALGQAIAKRLTAIREALASQTEGAAPRTRDAAQAGIAETRAWAGHIQAAARQISDQGNIQVVIAGIQPSDVLAGADPKDFPEQDIGAWEESLMGDEFVVVWGGPDVADCVAGLRHTCPEIGQLNQNATIAASTTRGNNELRKSVGVDGVVITMDLVALSVVPGGDANEIQKNEDSVGDKFLYLVQKHDPLSPTAHGKVLAAFALKGYGETSFVAVSELQDEMVENIVGFPKDWAQDSCKVAGPSAGESPEYCAGAKRHMFVPLENDLTTNTDASTSAGSLENSWKHYLDLAKEAAFHADDLGKEMIELGLQQDLRREAAQEELAQLCGSYSAVEEIEFDDYGNVGKPAKGTPLRTCLDEEKYALVFLTSMPPAEMTTSAAIKQDLLKCGQNQPGDSNPLCDAVITDKSLAALDLAPWDVGETGSTETCLRVAKVVGTSKSGFDGNALAAFMKEPWFGSGRINVIGPGSRVEVLGQGRWKLVSRGVKVMDSDPNSGLFPGCLRAGAEPCWEWPERVIAMSEAFRLRDQTYGKTTSCGFGHFELHSEAENKDYCLKPIGASGEEDLGPGVQFDPDLEAMAILWRVEGAVWFLASLAGEVPDDMFNVPVPVADFGNAAAWAASAYDFAPAHTVFGASVLMASAGGGYVIDSANDAERNAFTVANDIDSGFGWPNTDELPFWVRQPYKQTGASYRHIPVSSKGPNLELDFAQNDLITCAENLKGAYCEHQFYGDATIFGVLPPTTKQAYSDAAWDIGEHKRTAWGSWFLASGIVPHGSIPCNHMYPDGADPAPTWSTWAGVRMLCNGQQGGYARADELPPAERAFLSVNSYAWNLSDCNAMTQLAQTVSLACLLSDTKRSDFTADTPEIKSVNDMPGLELWIQRQALLARVALGRLYLEQLPKRVVEDINSGSVGSGMKDGQHGVLVTDLQPALLDIVNGWLAVQQQLAVLAGAVEVARNQISVLDLQADCDEAKLAVTQLQLTAAMVSQVATFISNIVATSPGEVWHNGVAQGNAVAQFYFLNEQQKLTEQIGQYDDQVHDEKVAGALIDLGRSTQEAATVLQQSMNQIRSSTAQAMALAHQVRQTERDAQWAAAKAKGEFFVSIDGEPVAIPVNAVYQRQYDITKQRYEKALKDAKYLAYVARLAIEQRIGRRLETMHTSVGPMEAPAIWADSVCSMEGLSYEDLSDVQIRFWWDQYKGSQPVEFDPVEAKFTLSELTKSSGLYVGDYVVKLENFVEYYNMQYPFHEGDDTAVLSLRDDVLGWDNTCVKNGPNLLLFSHDLDKGFVSTDIDEPKVGWARPACDVQDSTCVQVLPGYVLASPGEVTPQTFAPVPPGADGRSGATWIRDADPAVVGSWVGPLTTKAGVSQTVHIEDAGFYVLSWWDQARSASDTSFGEFPDEADPVVEYRVEVAKCNGGIVWGEGYAPHRPASSGATAAEEFSPHERNFEITDAGDYTVTFAPSDGLGDPGSVVLANVQLEKVPSAASGAGGYYGTDATRESVGRCTSLSPEELRSKFTRWCKAGECYYELASPLSIGTAFLTDPLQSSPGAMAQDNYNYRHMTVALNLVGTGLLDCSQSSASCYGNGIVRYTLEHVATKTPIINGYVGGQPSFEEFDFGTGAIRRGQALASERYITRPVSSADMALLSQAGVEKTEFMGRPVEGIYRLKIWDSPDLQWERLDDIQVLLRYRYWSAVDASH